jgi:leucyl/phenylalanyl-tRNA--protein transferase
METVLDAYRHGFFPMADAHEGIGFFAYDPRGIIPLDERFTVRRSLRRMMERFPYEIAFDTAPREVLQACSRLDDLTKVGENWLSEEMIEMYLQLFDDRIMHTVEIWKEGLLLGGLYGLTFGAAFCGESMFSRVPYASQIALVHLVERLRLKGFTLLDAQMPSDHLKQFGMYECSQADYLDLFYAASRKDVKW